MTKVAINGFGRIGRLVARAILERPDCGLELVAINDLADARSKAWLFERDSVHGRLPGPAKAACGARIAGLGASRATALPTPGAMPGCSGAIRSTAASRAR